MAKSKINPEEAELQVPSPTAPIEETPVETAGKDRAAEEVRVNTSAKKVQIHVTEDVDCLIACVPYNLAKGKDYKVPSDVAAILCYGGKAYRI